MTKIITLYHCSDCDYEAGAKDPVRKHILLRHVDEESVFLGTIEGIRITATPKALRDLGMDEESKDCTHELCRCIRKGGHYICVHTNCTNKGESKL
jgi:hypothetical protein